ncbi:MAG: glycogen debranching protein GlgX [Rhabdochlamydiaceae bacterium]
MRVYPGSPYPLGANWDGKGVNFALVSEKANSVDLLLYDNDTSSEPGSRIPLAGREAHVWHAYLPDILPGQLYAYSVKGPYDPEKGIRFNSNKALIDPYAKAIAGEIHWNDALFGYTIGDPTEDLSLSQDDSGAFVPKCVVVDTSFDWRGDRLLRTPWNETVIYELHVKGFTQLRHELAHEKRGTYSGLVSPNVIRYLKDLGISAVELLPVHHHVDNKFLLDRGLKNYWGYNTIGFFAPDSRFSSSGILGEQVNEFKLMVRSLHSAGIEVILDVVYNHTAEGNHLGPTLSLRGIDNTAYYKVSPDNPRYYADFTGTGNSLNMRNPQVIQLIMDSLRYWILDMHVDGFRFDLASTLAREVWDFDKFSSFFEVIQQDPVISQAKLIAEPWDVGPGGYQVGNFPSPWTEWNGRYRDSIRRFWRGDESLVPEIAYRLSGSSDIYQDGRGTSAGINFVTCHDGFTLADLVSYDSKHNESNLEDNKDGADDNLSWNCGLEGPTDDQDIAELRERQKRNFLATLIISQGVPMLLAGDEIGRTQKGNNNAYCQDNGISWIDWELDPQKRALLSFTRKLIDFRRRHPVLRRRKFFQGRQLFGASKDILWLQPNGDEMTDQVWNESKVRTIGMIISGDAMDEFNPDGTRIVDESLLILLNANPHSVPFLVPRIGEKWEVVLHTYSREMNLWESHPKSKDVFNLEGRSVVIMHRIL